MRLEVRKPLKGIMDFVDLINPYVVIVSILGLILEYTSLSAFGPLVIINQCIDLYFFIEFIFRLIAYKSASRYFFKQYGWVDMLAAVPGLMFAINRVVGRIGNSNALLGLIKLTRVGKFFKIIRILRFMRVFSFLKKMRSDSAYIQDRIMKMGVSTVLVVLVGLFFVDIINTNDFVNLEQEKIGVYLKVENKDKLFENLHKFDVRAYKDGEDCKKVVRAGTGDNARIVLVDISVEDFNEMSQKSFITPINVDKLPETSFLLNTEKSNSYHNNVMLILVLTIVLLLLVQIFYIGFVLAKDVRIVQLVVDSVEADDFFLLQEEQRQVELEEGNVEVVDGEDEFLSLRKVAGKIGDKFKEIEEREDSMREAEYMISVSEDAMKAEKMSLEEAIKNTADEIYARLSGKSVPSSKNDDIMSELGGGLVGLDELGFGNDESDDDVTSLTSEASSLDLEMLIDKIVEKSKSEISESWYNEGVEKVTKKIIIETLNKLMPKLKQYLDTKA